MRIGRGAFLILSWSGGMDGWLVGVDLEWWVVIVSWICA